MTKTIRTTVCFGLLLAALMPAHRALASWASEHCDGGGVPRDMEALAGRRLRDAGGRGGLRVRRRLLPAERLRRRRTRRPTAAERARTAPGSRSRRGRSRRIRGRRPSTASGSTRRRCTPYSVGVLRPAPGYPFRLIQKTYSAAAFMDALVERHSTWGHIALMYQEGSSGGDYIVHAGTTRWARAALPPVPMGRRLQGRRTGGLDGGVLPDRCG